MEKSYELTNCPQADGLQSNVLTCCDEDKQLNEKFGILSQLAAMLRGKKISPKRGYVRISFRIFLLVMAVGLAGGFYYLGTQGRQNVGIDQAQVEKLVEARVAEELSAVKNGIDQAQVDKLVEARVAEELVVAKNEIAQEMENRAPSPLKTWCMDHMEVVISSPFLLIAFVLFAALAIRAIRKLFDD